MHRLLIVDDELDICDCLRQYFSNMGFAVASAFSGEEALKRLDQDDSDVILLDILLPGISGIEVLRCIKERHPNVRVVMVSALDKPELRYQARRYGAADYITKPFDFSETTWASVLAA